MSDTPPNFGATGEFPDGRAFPGDEGEIVFGVGFRGDLVIVDFGTPVKWLGIPPDTAIELAESLLKAAAQVRGRFNPPPGLPS